MLMTMRITLQGQGVFCSVSALGRTIGRAEYIRSQESLLMNTA